MLKVNSKVVENGLPNKFRTKKARSEVLYKDFVSTGTLSILRSDLFLPPRVIDYIPSSLKALKDMASEGPFLNIISCEKPIGGMLSLFSAPTLVKILEEYSKPVKSLEKCASFKDFEMLYQRSLLKQAVAFSKDHSPGPPASFTDHIRAVVKRAVENNPQAAFDYVLKDPFSVNLFQSSELSEQPTPGSDLVFVVKQRIGPRNINIFAFKLYQELMKKYNLAPEESMFYVFRSEDFPSASFSGFTSFSLPDQDLSLALHTLETLVNAHFTSLQDSLDSSSRLKNQNMWRKGAPGSFITNPSAKSLVLQSVSSALLSFRALN